MRYKLTTQPECEAYTGESLEQLAQHLEIVQNQTYVQVWIHKEDGQALGVFFNRHFASVGWLTDDGDSATAIDMRYTGPDNALQEFYIEDGQLNEYPERNCLSRPEGLRALLDFMEQGQRPAWLQWHEE